MSPCPPYLHAILLLHKLIPSPVRSLQLQLWGDGPPEPSRRNIVLYLIRHFERDQHAEGRWPDRLDTQHAHVFHIISKRHCRELTGLCHFFTVLAGMATSGPT